MKKICLLFGLILTLGLSFSTALADDAKPPTKTSVATPDKPPAPPPKTDASVAGGEEKPADKPAEKPKTEPTESTQKWWQNALVIVIEGAVAIVMPILSILLMILIRKWNLKIEQEKVDWVLDKSLGAGEQKLKTLLKDGKPVEGPVIVKAALDTGGPLLEKYGLAKKFGDWLAEGIEARLGEKVIAAGGAKQPALEALVAKPAAEDVEG